MANRFYCINVSLQYFKTTRTASFFFITNIHVTRKHKHPQILSFLTEDKFPEKSVLSGGSKGGGMGDLCPPPFFFFFFTKTKFTSKISTKQAQNLSQNAGNGHFRDSNFQKFMWEHAPRPP